MSSVGSDSQVLTQLDLYDWGAFGGRHSARIDLAGTAIIGPTGSGKTTLVDALMTLLVANPRYNLASTGGHESDRDLVSYVRGVTGAGNDGDGNEHIARSGAVVSAIAARFAAGASVLRIGGLFWFDGSSSATTDLKRRWVFCQSDTPDLDEWLAAHRDGSVRALKELERSSPGLKIYETRQAYLARLRNHFEVGENAFTLLNRAAGLKQLNSIDTVFRELVLDDHSVFDDARDAAGNFDTLAGIRQELEVARQQRDSLLPIAAGWTELQKHRSERDTLTDLKRILPVWFALHAAQRWRAQGDALHLRTADLEAGSITLAQRLTQAQQEEHAAHAAYLEAGGGDIERLRGQIQTQNTLLASRERAAQDYQSKAAALELDTRLSATSVQANLDAIARMRPAHQAQFQQLQQRAWEQGSSRAGLEQRHDGIARELDEVRRRPESNVPPPQQNFRHALTTHLGLREDDVPFVAELIEVKAEERRWRGAIERAIGGERLRLLIRPQHIAAALDWVNARDNRLHVRLHEVKAQAAAVAAFEDGFLHKLNFKAHPLKDPLYALLAGRDRHCVADLATLRVQPQAMTVEGLMSGRQRFFDKDDHRALDQGWMTGFDNRDRIRELSTALQQLQVELEQSRAQEKQARLQAESMRRSLDLLESLQHTVFEDIDLPGAQVQLEQLRQELDRLTAPRSDAVQAQLRWQRAREAVAKLRDEEVGIRAEMQDLARQQREVVSRLQRLDARTGAGLDPQDQTLATAHFRPLDEIALDELDEIERRRSAELQGRIDAATHRCGQGEKRLIIGMKDAKQLDTGALVNSGSDLQDIEDFLERLRVLEEEALPTKRERFLSYLNQSSDQGVTQLLSNIDGEVTVIEERIADLNTTLERVDFQPGRYLRLEPQRVEHESLRTLWQARAQLRSAQLKDDQGESHYAALAHLVGLLRDAVDRRKTQGALALLDPRYRLQFAVLVIERGSGRVIEKRTSSQGGSGGEKEIIASYVLTASLSYALCPPGSERPLFGTIVLDEAFSKSSQAVAGRIIRALAEFGLHPLFVTPNKELRLLRDHTRSAIVVHRKGAQATLTSLSWEQLEAHARGRLAGNDGASR